MAFIKLIFLLLTVTILTTFAQKKRIPIGGIFHYDNFDAEIAFRNAIIRDNMYNQRIEFIPIVERIDRDDSFRAEKIGCELASQGVAAIFGPTSVRTSKIVASICNELHIPHILASWFPEDQKDATENHQYTRNFFPDNDVYARALSQILVDYEWKRFTLIYENSDSLERLFEILQLHGTDDDPVTIRQLPVGTDDYQPFLKQIQMSLPSRIIIDCSPEKVIKLLQQAKLVGMMDDYQNYFITSLDSHVLDFADLKLDKSNITTLRIMDPLSMEVMTAVHDWQQDSRRKMDYTIINSESIKTEAALYNDAAHVFAAAFRESNALRDITPMPLRCTESRKWNQGIQILQMMDQKTADGMTGRIVFDDNGRRKDFHMEILKLNHEGLKKIATLDPKDFHINFTRTTKEMENEIAQSLQNNTLIVASRIGKPWLDWKDVNAEGNDRFEGYAVDLIDEIATSVGFSYKFVLVEKYGKYDPITKEWNGLVRELRDRKAHLAICDFTITYERRTAVDFTMPFMSLGISILFAKPEKKPRGVFSFMLPLSIEVWLLMATSYLCMAILLYFLAMIARDDWEIPPPVAISQTNLANSEPSDEPEEEEEEVLETIWNMHNWIWLVAGSIMQQGCDILPKAISTRLIAGLWWFFALIVISSYTANLAAFLTTDRMDESIASAEDLSKQNDIKYGCVDEGTTKEFFKNSNFSTYQRMWAAMESASPSVFVKNNSEGIERVEKSNRKYAFLMESTSIEYIIERKKNLTQVGTLLDSKSYGIAMPIDAHYRTLISEKVLKMQEGGRLRELKQKWWEEGKEEKKKTDSDTTTAMEMESVIGCFLVLVGGIVAAILLGICEFMWNVNKISVDQKVTRWEAFREEILFAFDFRKTKKPVRINLSEQGSISNRSSKSINDRIGWKY